VAEVKGPPLDGESDKKPRFLSQEAQWIIPWDQKVNFIKSLSDDDLTIWIERLLHDLAFPIRLGRREPHLFLIDLVTSSETNIDFFQRLRYSVAKLVRYCNPELPTYDYLWRLIYVCEDLKIGEAYEPLLQMLRNYGNSLKNKYATFNYEGNGPDLYVDLLNAVAALAPLGETEPFEICTKIVLHSKDSGYVVAAYFVLAALRLENAKIYFDNFVRGAYRLEQQTRGAILLNYLYVLDQMYHGDIAPLVIDYLRNHLFEPFACRRNDSDSPDESAYALFLADELMKRPSNSFLNPFLLRAIYKATNPKVVHRVLLSETLSNMKPSLIASLRETEFFDRGVAKKFETVVEFFLSEIGLTTLVKLINDRERVNSFAMQLQSLDWVEDLSSRVQREYVETHLEDIQGGVSLKEFAHLLGSVAGKFGEK
jgi:hypothetical protein